MHRGTGVSTGKNSNSVTHHFSPTPLNSGAVFKQNHQVANIASGGAQSIDLDLTSTAANIQLGTSPFGAAKQLTINVGGVEQTFKPGSTATAAEYVALQQVAGHGNQAIVLSNAGAAIGGYFSLNAADKGSVSGIVVPSSVSAIDYASKNSTLTFSGDLTNYGSIYAVSSAGKSATGMISALDIVNEAGATISRSVPSSLLRAVGHSFNPNAAVNLTLDATGDITNARIVTTGGALILATGSGNLTNNGLIASTHSNINITAPSSNTDINISAILCWHDSRLKG